MHGLSAKQLDHIRLAINGASVPGRAGYGVHGFIGQLALLEGYTAADLARWDAFHDVEGPLTPRRLIESGNAFADYPADLLESLHAEWGRQDGGEIGRRRAAMVSILANWQHVAQPRPAAPHHGLHAPAWPPWLPPLGRVMPWLGMGTAGAVLAFFGGVVDLHRLPGRVDRMESNYETRLDSLERRSHQNRALILRMQRRQAYAECMIVGNAEPVCRGRHLLGQEEAP